MNVLHYLFEEDMRYSSENEISAKSAVREETYRRFYGREYPYKYVKPKEKNSYEDYEDEYDPDDPYGLKSNKSFQPFDPVDAGDPDFTHKGFTPATDFDGMADNPFDGILDAPAN